MGVFTRHGAHKAGVAISFGERFAASDQFDAIFREGMALVERTAAYLDGPGRREAKALPAPAAMLYAKESMRLTNRLLKLASWLMIRRDHKEGKITPQVMQRKLTGVTLTEPGRISHVEGFDTLPEGLRTLIVASFALNDRIVRLDQAMQVKVEHPDGLEEAVDAMLASPVQLQMSRIERAFSRPRLRAVSSSS